MHRSTIATTILGAFIVVLGLVACGPSGAAPSGPGGGEPGHAGGSAAPSTPPDPGSVAAIDTCSVLSDDEIRAATDQGVTSRTPSTLTQVYASVCDIVLDGGGQLFVSALPTGGRAMYEESFEPFIGQGQLLDEAVNGLGDKAARSGDGTLMVLRGDTLFELQYLGPASADRQSVLRYLAEIFLTKLPCLAVGCPDTTPPPPPTAAEGADVCGLLSADEIEDATGFPVTATEPGDGTCRWALETPTMAGLDGVELTLLASGGRAKFDYWANDYFEVAPEHVSGIGDDAIMTGTIPAGAVHVVSGDRLLTLEFSLPLAVSDPYARITPLAGLAAGRLP